jgi:hypothetical protein
MIRSFPRTGFAILMLAVGLVAADAPKPRTYHGEISDSQCAMNVHSLTRSHQEMLKSKSMGGTSSSCSKYCVARLGGVFVLSSKEDVYRLDDQDSAAKFVGEKVKITGSVKEDGRTLHVISIDPEK